MRSIYYLLAGFLLLASAFSFVNGSCDPGPLQDYCVATNEPDNQVFVNGKFCKNPRKVTARDFKFTGLGTPGNTNNSLGYSSTERSVNEFSGLNTLSLSVTRGDYARGGVVPLHIHPRANQVLMVTQGIIVACFISSRENNYTHLCNKLRAGDGMVTPKALPHYAFNIGKNPAVAFASYDSQNPGLIGLAESSFATTPPISDDVLTQAYKISKKWVSIIRRRFADDPTRVYNSY
ncbi:hypothetical protein ACFE04_013138 [Oxalis oulophora]